MANIPNRDATIYRYIVYRIVLSLYRCIDTKSTHIDISRYIDVSWLVVMNYNQIIVHCDQPKWYIVLLKEKKASFISLKSNTEQCFDSTSYRTIYHCIVIHQRQYIVMPTHCIAANNQVGLWVTDTSHTKQN